MFAIAVNDYSPHAWGGVQNCTSTVAVLPGAIPTCVGGYCCRGYSCMSRLEPSPHAWGLHNEKNRNFSESGAIPTCVGVTLSSSILSGLPRSHPHMRGGYRFAPLCIRQREEPSPHAWGLQPEDPLISVYRGAIPTCVGVTGFHRSAVNHAWSHPHMRGGYQWCITVKNLKKEPSPHAWGLPDFMLLNDPVKGAIPTCVGVTTCRVV